MNTNELKQKIMNIVSVPPEAEGETGYLKLTNKEIDEIIRVCQGTKKDEFEKIKYRIIDVWDTIENEQGNINDSIKRLKESIIKLKNILGINF